MCDNYIASGVFTDFTEKLKIRPQENKTIKICRYLKLLLEFSSALSLQLLYRFSLVLHEYHEKVRLEESLKFL